MYRYLHLERQDMDSGKKRHGDVISKHYIGCATVVCKHETRYSSSCIHFDSSSGHTICWTLAYNETKRNITHIVVQNAEPFVVSQPTVYVSKFHTRVSLICLRLLVFFWLPPRVLSLIGNPNVQRRGEFFGKDDLNQQNSCQPENCYQNRTIPASIDPHLFILSNFYRYKNIHGIQREQWWVRREELRNKQTNESTITTTTTRKRTWFGTDFIPTLVRIIPHGVYQLQPWQSKESIEENSRGEFIIAYSSSFQPPVSTCLLFHFLSPNLLDLVSVTKGCVLCRHRQLMDCCIAIFPVTANIDDNECLVQVRHGTNEGLNRSPVQ